MRMRPVTKRLRQMRKERWLTQHETARRARMTQAVYWKIEQGYSVPSDLQAERIARVFNLPVGEVFPPSKSASTASSSESVEVAR